MTDPFLEAAAEALAQAASRVRLLGATTPVNAAEERARLVAGAARGEVLAPRWRHAAPDTSLVDVARGLHALVARLEALGPDRRVAAHAARAAELATETEAVLAVGTAAFAAKAEARFPAPSTTAAAACRAEARAAAAHDDAPRERGPEDEATVTTDGPEPGSLLSALRRAVGARRLPFAVVVEPRLSALAATAEGHLLVAAGRRLSPRDVERIVLHEIEGHALPRVRARAAPRSLRAVGTAGGVDDQEGYALMLERRAGFLVGARHRELGLRWLAVDAMRDGAGAEDVLALLLREHGAPPEVAVRLVERVFRGSAGLTPGLGRERVYLEALRRVEAHLAAHPADEPVLGGGCVALGWIDVARDEAIAPGAPPGDVALSR